MADVNPHIFQWNGPLGLPEFDKIASTDFKEAFDHALTLDRAHIDAIADNGAEPTFENTIEALEGAHDANAEALSRVASIYWNLVGADSNDDLRAIEGDIASRLSRHSSETATNKKLFSRIDALWQNRDSLSLTHEQERVLERKWKGFVKGGAALPDAEQKTLADINARLAELGANFSQNVLGDEKDWFLILTDEAELTGLSEGLRQSMKSAAEERGKEGYAVTLSRSIIEPFLSSSDRRDLREQAYKAWLARGENEGERDNREIIAETLKLRQQRAELLGHENFARFKLEDQMAKTPEAVVELLETVWDKAKAKAEKEEADLAQMIARTGANHDVAPWDWRYYSEKVRAEKFDFDEDAIKPYLSLDAMIEAAFDVATKLFGITFKEHKDANAYHPDARIFEVLNKDGSHRATFIGDYFARTSKRSGAWMSAFQGQHKLGEGQAPIIINVCNFAKPPKGQPALISMEDARTLFHEFGHALHGILSDVTYPSVAGTSVARDFVELPSQLYEHWLTVPAVLSQHARHVETGEPMPRELLDKVLAAQTFNAGFAAVEFTASALVDMAFHTAKEVPEDVIAFEKQELERLGMPKAISMRHRTPHFAHVFSGDGYSAGYYSYMWSEVLDADAFSAFEETGDVFDIETAKRLHDHIYSAGGSVDPEETYKAFRGKMPTADAMIEKRGLG
ncbi:M3 family metallopeptidase [Pseudahrensia aquimaris]|uniref:M3 family metallopeptidase n=1 Tax=Pseudahrensia aquimaris TaxID=744461 RepID=A0ABW3FFS8_9HYPH